MTRIAILLSLLAIIGCERKSLNPKSVAEIKPAPQDNLPDIIRDIITRPWPGVEYPKRPKLSVEISNNALKEIESSPIIKEAISNLNPSKHSNVEWFKSIEILEERAALFCLLTCLCHPSPDVQIKSLRSIARIKNSKALPFLLVYASAMAYPPKGSESATILCIRHEESANALAAITGQKYELSHGNTAEDLKIVIKACIAWQNNHEGLK